MQTSGDSREQRLSGHRELVSLLGDDPLGLSRESPFSQSVVTRVSQCLLLHPFLCHALLALGFGTSDLVSQLLFT